MTRSEGRRLQQAVESTRNANLKDVACRDRLLSILLRRQCLLNEAVCSMSMPTMRVGKMARTVAK